MKLITRSLPLALLLTGGCKDVEEDDHHHHEHEVITTVVLAFTPHSGGADLEFVWADPEEDGNPEIDDIVLLDAEDYDLTVSFLNELEEPAEDVTPEIADEGDEHQLFFTGSAVQGPATGTNTAAVVEHAYADADDNGLPIGLDSTITTLGVGSGELTVTLRHMPLENDAPIKDADTAQTVADQGFDAIGGENDVQITFNLDVE